MSKALFQGRHAWAAGLRIGGTATAIMAFAVMAGCTRTDSVVVGAVPDDYRTNHPIVITEKDEVIDLPVASSDHTMTPVQKVALDGFMANYDRRSGSLVRIMVPSDTANSAAASRVARDLAARMQVKGVPGGRIVTLAYKAGSPQAEAPIRVAYGRMQATTGPCGRWPDDILGNGENKHYANFGCSYQNNLAAQIANPADLIGPREQTEIDAANRVDAIREYEERGVADYVRGNREVDF
ncbi:CpaD family pilus assembly protein [Mesorhizobium xinjiangense]|uniref:CpaD family pilus assembly protein n=1 Tax=Mesorhizobium xinjiangense TaxID=2678685 RepID=UPI0012ED2782|nr:CpaD family pilus assembly protein [Mesorhizobium xinjiangense]